MIITSCIITSQRARADTHSNWTAFFYRTQNSSRPPPPASPPWPRLRARDSLRLVALRATGLRSDRCVWCGATACSAQMTFFEKNDFRPTAERPSSPCRRAPIPSDNRQVTARRETPLRARRAPRASPNPPSLALHVPRLSIFSPSSHGGRGGRATSDRWYGQSDRRMHGTRGLGSGTVVFGQSSVAHRENLRPAGKRGLRQDKVEQDKGAPEAGLLKRTVGQTAGLLLRRRVVWRRFAGSRRRQLGGGRVEAGYRHVRPSHGGQSGVAFPQLDPQQGRSLRRHELAGGPAGR